MIDKGANPFVVAYGGSKWLNVFKLDHLSNLPSKQSVFFTTRQFPDEFQVINDFPDPWFYVTDVFNGQFDSVVGQGASGIVVKGKWYGKKAAFKFVEVGTQTFQKSATEAIKSLNDKLYEMTSIIALVGSRIVSFYGHYR